MKPAAAACLLCFLTPTLVRGHEGVGRAGLRSLEEVEVESEFYAGRNGYWHAGLGLIAPLGDGRKLGITAHLVREETGGETFPSLGAEFVQSFGRGFEMEAFTFGYLPVEDHKAWAAGLRMIRHIDLAKDLTVSPFFGPAWARVTAVDEATDRPVGIDHLMFMGGVVIEREHRGLSIFASHSFFSRDPSGMETHVDLEEMTHFAAYENNDGFARNTAGAEVWWRPKEWLTLTARYAFMRFEDETRHAVSFTPSIRVSPGIDIFSGFQLLRGDETHNNLFTAGVSVSF